MGRVEEQVWGPSSLRVMRWEADKALHEVGTAVGVEVVFGH